MVLVRRIHKRGANIVVEAHGEVLFTPVGPVGRWTNRFSQRVRAFAAEEAPSNKRPRWAHYGRPLKTTMTASTTYQPGRMKVYAAVGSSSPHAYYVDQGTGVYAGNGPYEAKVLPPWGHGDPSLYESTWRPGGPGTRKVKPVLIKGQKGQFFFDSALKRGFMSMRMRSFQVPGEGLISQALASFPTGLAGFLGNTEANGAFVAQLEEWRAWRDAAFARGERLNRSRYDSQAAYKRHKAREAAKARQHRPKPPSPSTPPKPKRPPKPKKKKKGYDTLREKQDAAVAAFRKQNPQVKILGRVTQGLVIKAPVDGRRYVIPWSRLYVLL